MDRYQKILSNITYIKHMNKINELEKDRKFCRHGSNHFLDVCRIAMLINVDEAYGIDKDIIYAAALLHDIGRDAEYLDGVSHEIASADISKGILLESGFKAEEIENIIKAILNHRNKSIKDEKSLSGLIYRADKLSRPCYLCDSYNECNKAYEKRNDTLIW